MKIAAINPKWGSFAVSQILSATHGQSTAEVFKLMQATPAENMNGLFETNGWVVHWRYSTHEPREIVEEVIALAEQTQRADEEYDADGKHITCIPKVFLDATTLLTSAKNHSDDSDPNHEVGDLQNFLKTAMEIMTPVQRFALYQHDNVVTQLEIGLPEEQFSAIYPDAESSDPEDSASSNFGLSDVELEAKYGTAHPKFTLNSPVKNGVTKLLRAMRT